MKLSYIYAICRESTGLICTLGWEPVGGKPVMAVYRSRKQAEKNCPSWAEIKMFREVKAKVVSRKK